MEMYAIGAPLSLSFSRRTVNVGSNRDLVAALDAESSVVSRVFETVDKHEGMSAFSEKRSPRFRGA